MRANSFAFDFDFTYDASNVNSAFANKNIIAEIGIVPTRPSGLSVNMLLTNTYSDISYDQWVASEGANLTGSADQVDTYTLEDGNYKAHFDIKTIDDYQYFVGIVSKYESDNSLTDIGITSASFNGASIENSRDFDVFVDGSYESGVSSLTNFNLAVTQLPKIFEEFEGTGDDDTIYGTSQEDVIYGYEGNDTIRGLASADTIYGGDGNDKIFGGLGDDIISGGAGDDYILAQTGNDTITTGTGTDQISAGIGNDTITIDGVGDKTVYGGAGTDSLTVNVSGHTSLSDYNITHTTGIFTLKSKSSNETIIFSSIENLTVGSQGYNWTDGKYLNIQHSDSGNFIWEADKADNPTFYLIDGSSEWSGYSDIDGGMLDGRTLFGAEGPGLSDHRNASSTVTVVGSNVSDHFQGGMRRDSHSEGFQGSWNISLGDGGDRIGDGSFKNGDSVDMGAGNDNIDVRIDNNESYKPTNGTPSLSSFNMVKLDGGSGTDWLKFDDSGSADGSEITLATGGAVNFENLVGTNWADTIRGDSGDNEIFGGDGADTIYGGAGNDTLLTVLPDRLLHNTPNLYFFSTSKTTGSYDDNLYGQAGNDILIAGSGDNTLDGGTGSDTITTGSGEDTIILRSGDGGSTLADADTITDFTDGTDALGLDNGLAYTDLTIAQGTGSNSSDTIISKTDTSEYLTILTGISANNISFFDFTYMGTDNQTLNGTSGNDVLLGAAGNDTITTGTGTDQISAGIGNDTITIDGVGDKTVYGGAGTDSLTVNVSGHTSLSDYNITHTTGIFTLKSKSSNETIIFSSIENLTVGSQGYNWTDGKYLNIQHSDSGNFIWEADKADNPTFYLIDGSSEWSGYSDIDGGMLDGRTLFGAEGPGLSDHRNASSTVTVVGSNVSDHFQGGMRRDSHSEGFQGSWNISLGDGGDRIGDGSFKNGDSVDMGAGNDNIDVRIDNNESYKPTNGTPSLSSFNMVKLDGGSGTDWLKFDDSGSADGSEITLATGGAVNFENLVGTNWADTIRGDSGDNEIFGGDGADTIYGGAGNDTLLTVLPDRLLHNTPNLYFFSTSKTTGSYDDNLYGQAGNDILIAGSGDNTLDGGTGSDTITTGSGEDTIILRSGDGGSTLADADTITDFTDGTDALGLDNGLAYTDLTIAQGTGSNSSDTIISKTDTSEYLTILTGISANNISFFDFTYMGTDNQTLNGTSGNDVLLGAAGNDTITTGTGTDQISAGIGNDTITIDGVGDKTVYGGAGTDSLTVNVSGHTSLSDYNITHTTGIFTLKSKSSNETIIFSSIENLTVGSQGYNWTDGKYLNIQHSDSGNFIWEADKADNPTFYLIDGSSEWSGYSDIDGGMLDGRTLFGAEGPGLSDHRNASSTVTVVGSNVSDHFQGGMRRDSHSEGFQGSWNISLGDGGDRIGDGSFKNGDSVDMGAGNDNIDVRIDNNESYKPTNGTPSLSSFNMVKLDGGSGTDWLKFDDSGSADGSEITLATGGAVNFENLVGTNWADTIRGDSGDNEIFGGDGADTIYGGAGNDTLLTVLPDRLLHNTPNLYFFSTSKTTGSYDDNLYGQAGNDILIAGSGDNTLDGGTGSDTITTGSGEDTIILRSGDGGSTLADADTITDFTDGTDALGLDNGLAYTDLTIAQGTGSNSSDTIISKTDTSEYLTILTGISASALSEEDFTPVDIV